jgi:hypothetical protein
MPMPQVQVTKNAEVVVRDHKDGFWDLVSAG